jgi:hypothetical protein
MLATWHTLQLGRHCAIGSSDLAAYQPFDLSDYGSNWLHRLEQLHTVHKICVLHLTAVLILDHIPIDSIAQHADAVLVLDDEGMTTARSDIAKLLECLANLGINSDRIMLWSDAGNQGLAYGQSLTAFSNPDTNRVAEFSHAIHHHYVMLARVPRRHRIMAACELLDRGLEPYGRISCGSGGYQGYTHGPNEFMLVPDRLRHRFPIYIDGPVSHDDLAIHIRSVLDPAITGAFAQLVCESNWEDPDPAIGDRWKLMQLTEKTSKPLLLGQVFILNSAFGSVAALRDLGFDCFDDIIDHGYDQEANPVNRVSLAVDQLARLCAHDMDHWQCWRSDNVRRLLANRQLFLKIASDLEGMHRQRFQKAVSAVDSALINL